jgi:ribosome recycling factor
MSKQDSTTIVNGQEYAEILQQAVLEIQTARASHNLWNMKRFYERYYQADTKLRQAVAVLPWGHNLVLINKLT